MRARAKQDDDVPMPWLVAVEACAPTGSSHRSTSGATAPRTPPPHSLSFVRSATTGALQCAACRVSEHGHDIDRGGGLLLVRNRTDEIEWRQELQDGWHRIERATFTSNRRKTPSLSMRPRCARRRHTAPESSEGRGASCLSSPRKSPRIPCGEHDRATGESTTRSDPSALPR